MSVFHVNENTDAPEAKRAKKFIDDDALDCINKIKTVIVNHLTRMDDATMDVYTQTTEILERVKEIDPLTNLSDGTYEKIEELHYKTDTVSEHIEELQDAYNELGDSIDWISRQLASNEKQINKLQDTIERGFEELAYRIAKK